METQFLEIRPFKITRYISQYCIMQWVLTLPRSAAVHAYIAWKLAICFGVKTIYANVTFITCPFLEKRQIVDLDQL